MAYYPTQEDIMMLSFPEKILHVKILLLNDKFQTIYEMKHEYISGNLSTNVNSDIRNTLSMTLGVISKNVGISENRLLWIDQFVKIYFGVQVPFKNEPVWYDKGIYVMTDYSYNAQSRLLQVNCSDLVCKLNGDVDGALEGLEHVIYEEDKLTIREAMIQTLTQLTPFTKYNIIDMPKLIPYDLEFNATDTVWTILTKLRDLYNSGCEMFFDTDGTFVCKEIASKESDPIVLDDSILQKLYVSENDSGILKDIRNVSKVWGKCLETDYYTDSCTYDESNNTYNAHYVGIALNDDNSLPTSTKFAAKIPTFNTKKSPKLAVYNKPTSDGTETLIGTYPIVDSLEQEVDVGFFAEDSSYVFRVRRNNMYALGQWQIFAVNKLRNAEPTEEEKTEDIEKHGTKDITYTIMPDSPFSVEKIGERMRSFQGGEYDDIEAIDDCITRAEYETWKAARTSCTVTLNMVYIPWLQGNEKIRFKYSESGEIKDWIVQNVSTNNLNGTMNMTMTEFYPSYNFAITYDEITVLLPEGYTELTYIESTGTQYVNTAVLPDNDVGMQIDVEIATFTKGNVFAGSRVSGDTRFWFGAEGSATSPTFYYGWNNVVDTSISVSGRKKINFNYLNDRKVYVDTELAGIISTAYTSNPNPIYIFCGNEGGKTVHFFPLKLYGMKITKGDSVIRNYIPCTNANGTVGLYDLVEGKFYENAGTGEFIAGAEKVHLPNEYTQTEYIQSSGTQYVDTGVTGKSGLKIKGRFSPSVVGASIPIGCITSQRCYLLSLTDTNAVRYGYVDWYTSSKTLEVGKWYEFEVDFSVGSQSVKIDGVTVASSTNSTTITSSHNVFLFAYNDAGTAGDFFKGKFDYVKIYDGDTLIRNFIPCTNASGEAGLYELVNSKFYGNAGTDQFFAPVPVKLPSGYKQVDWIQSSGTQCIDTGYCVNQNTKIIADAEYLADSGDYPMLFGSWENTTTQFAIFYKEKWNAWFGSATVTIGGEYSGRKIFSLDNTTFKVGNNSATVSGGTFTSTLPLYLFADKQSDKAYYYATIRLHGMQIYDNGIIVRNFIPCTNASGVAGLYDLVNNEFYTNKGTGEFIIPS